jgi:hypothetical protein
MKSHAWQKAKSVVLVCSLGLAALQTGGCATYQADAAKPPPLAAESGGGEDLGINILGVRRAASGYMLDLRYKVVDPEKAGALVDRKVHPYLIAQSSGARLFVPSSAKIGPLRQTSGNAVEGHTYFALFANPGRHVEAGQKVTLVVGERRVENLAVLE